MTCPLTFLGQARSGDILSSWDKPALGTCPLTFLRQARSGDMPFKILGTCPLSGHALLSSKFLGLDRSWYMPSWDGQRTEYSVPLCNVQAYPESEYDIIKYDGKCHKYNKLLSDWKRKAQCPKCQQKRSAASGHATCPSQFLGHARSWNMPVCFVIAVPDELLSSIITGLESSSKWQKTQPP